MISISLIGVAAALVVCAIVAKLLASEPKKASKSEKAVIMKQLLALSEGENALTRKAPSVRARTPLANRSTPLATALDQNPNRLSQRCAPMNRQVERRLSVQVLEIPATP